MATLIEIDTLAQDTTFLTKVRGGLMRKAGEIGSLILAMDGPGIWDKVRLIHARSVLQDLETWTAAYARVLAADSSIIDSSVDDNTLLFYIADYWNLMAGVSI